MNPAKLGVMVIGTLALMTGQAYAITTVSGRIVKTEGHEVTACRTVVLKRSDNGQLMSFRIPNGPNNEETGIMALTLTALASRLTVDIAYDADLTTGCGTEPRIRYISLIAAP